MERAFDYLGGGRADISPGRERTNLNPPDLMDPPLNPLPCGGTKDGPWRNPTVDVRAAAAMNRRDMLKTAGAAALGFGLGLRSLGSGGHASGDGASSPLAPRPERTAATGFTHRLLLGWINDNSSRPLSGKRWPIVDMGEDTVLDYQAFLRVARDHGYTGITLWGIFASHAWSVPLRNSVTPERRRLFERIRAEADRLGIKVLYGLGVYSWGFEEIIRRDPTAARSEGRRAWGSFEPDNGVAMCYQSASARQWMRDIVDLCVEEAGTQGFGLQSGDLGRCYCHECRKMSDNEYHTRVVNETATYIRQRHPGQLVGLSAWGVDFGGGPRSLDEMASHLDFMTDVTDQAARRGGGYRRAMASRLPCALCSLGGAVIVPPQRWARDRWFLPHADMTARSIRSLHDDGGRAFEFFMGPLANPQYNLMTRFVGLMLSDPTQTADQALSRVIEEVCDPRDAGTTERIVRWMLDVERAYFGRVGDVSSGEFDFEPLKGENAGGPVYLTRLPAGALAGYGADLERLAGMLPAMASGCRHPEVLLRIQRCLANVLVDVRQVQGAAKP